VDIAKSQFPGTCEGLGFQACHSASIQSISYCPVFKTKYSRETTGKCSLWNDGWITSCFTCYREFAWTI